MGISVYLPVESIYSCAVYRRSSRTFRPKFSSLVPTTSNPMAVRLFSLLVLLTTATLKVDAACDNYGIESGSNCQCPPGVGGANCSLPVCGGTLFDGPSRPLAQPVGSALYGNLSTCTCPDGWQGLGCNSTCSSVWHRHLLI